MKHSLTYFCACLCLVLAFLSGASVAAQTNAPGDKATQTTNIDVLVKDLPALVRAKRQKDLLTIISLDKPFGFSTTETGALANQLNPCETGTAISIGQTLSGQLTSADCQLSDGSFVDFYVFSGSQGQQVTVSMNSAQFDTYLGLSDESGAFTREDDNGGGGTNSRIVATLPATGLYAILANSLYANQFGNYSLSLSGGTTSCTYSLSPSSATVNTTGGNYSFTVNTQPGCQWAAAANTEFVSTSSAGTGSGTVFYSVQANNTGATRSGTITVNGQMFTITQLFECVYSLSPTSATVAASGGTYSFNVNAAPGCTWSASVQGTFITANSQGSGGGAVSYIIAANNTGTARTGYIVVRGQTFTVTQPPVVCTYSISPSSANFSSEAASGSIAVTTQPGCGWSGVLEGGNLNFIHIQNNGTGSGTLNYLITVNNGANRTSRINVMGEIHTVSQVGRNCTYALSPGFLEVDRLEHAGAIQIDTQPGCTWTATTNNSFVQLQNTEGGGAGAINYQISANNSFSYRNGSITIRGRDFMRVSIRQSGFPRSVPFDFDGDRKSDIGVYRPSTGVWWLNNSRNNDLSVTNFGLPEDIPVPADYDGDRDTDITIFRPSESAWYRLNTSDNTFTVTHFGQPGDIPVPGDYNGYTQTQYAVYRPSDGTWYRYISPTMPMHATQWGLPEDIPQVGDFDNDHKTDFAVFRPSVGVWFILRSSDLNARIVQFGLTGDKPAVGDFDGDGKTDICVYRPSDGVWYRLNSSNNEFVAQQFGIGEDIPVPADYDGDNKADIAVFRPSTGAWWSFRSATGQAELQQFGLTGDMPTSAAIRR